MTVYGTEPVIDALRTHLLNGTIWPDFTALPTPDEPVLRYDIITPGRPLTLGCYDHVRRCSDGYVLTAVEVNHTVPAVGYCVEKMVYGWFIPETPGLPMLSGRRPAARMP